MTTRIWWLSDPDGIVVRPPQQGPGNGNGPGNRPPNAGGPGRGGPGRGGPGQGGPGAGGGGGGGGEPAPFTMADIFASGTTNGGYWDLSDLSTLFQTTAETTPVTAAGQKVARVNDKSGYGRHLLQSSGTSQPTWIADGSADFNDANEQFWQTATYAGSLAIFDANVGFLAIAYTADNAEALDVLIGEQGTINFWRVSMYADTRSTPNRFANVAPDSVDDYINYPSEQAADTRVAILNNEGGTVRAYVNGTALADTTTITQAIQGGTNSLFIEVGRQSAGTVAARNHLNGKIFQMAAGNKTLSSDEIANITALFSGKAGL